MGIWPLCPASCRPQVLCCIFYPLLSQLADREVRQRIGLLPGARLDLAVLLVGWCRMGLAARGGDGESVAGREAEGRARCKAHCVLWLPSLGSEQLSLRCMTCPTPTFNWPPASRNVGRHLFLWSPGAGLLSATSQPTYMGLLPTCPTVLPGA